ncbi:D-glycero-alpha-D-manno-heptose-1,7-bisphosphate 7-phosphatase [Aliirhizobium cellulosilyticum]|uniref:D,D-heptose 1,7-bisphosphate phosphatase n=1 Tax=Aliirhizobium cellulosilyticum TaxID=393664 RepID=A0A7W6TEF8_9HYPH|nr:HAD family hydrolase [Rhizobium cellulosilyticum]MBB4348723.1 D-glycero-D-manno-heptose 1,7-bisphosphate phosphatase [Rhizobium cellulosilyticum]MBB4411959.1 D-glycero-D-manno-heptose 1,7-bisphosphate phosphatase [Rhizobium cellulosilyticum]MBB4449441.1 D-glycero-D-manno-heptose 1,7-bisphosphate phosphatase [Rhizobium cellulosilyticum]
MSRDFINDPRQDGADRGLWIEIGTDAARFANRPALFLDRDGVINVDCGYPSKPSDIIIIEDIIPTIRLANEAGWPVVVVTNQSGIARGYFTWSDFAAVTAHIDAELDQRGARIDAVLACGYHQVGHAPLNVANHPMRKPQSGMFVEAQRNFKINLKQSIMIGDKITDFQAAKAAGIVTCYEPVMGPSVA